MNVEDFVKKGAGAAKNLKKLIDKYEVKVKSSIFLSLFMYTALVELVELLQLLSFICTLINSIQSMMPLDL